MYGYIVPHPYFIRSIIVPSQVTVYILENCVYNFKYSLFVNEVRPQEYFVSCMSAVNFMEKVIILTFLLWAG